MNRFYDLIFSSVGLLLLAPVLAAITLIVRLSDGGPALYRARRVGRGGAEFLLLKFRTMRVHSDRKGPAITARGDTRVTRIGCILRRTKLDELPQLLNVVRGEMSLVGPRPEDPRYVALYTPQQRAILSVRPGITSAASLKYRNEEALLAGSDWEQIYRNKVMPEKLAIDLDYLSHRTLASDLKLVLRTLTEMVH